MPKAGSPGPGLKTTDVAMRIHLHLNHHLIYSAGRGGKRASGILIAIIHFPALINSPIPHNPHEAC